MVIMANVVIIMVSIATMMTVMTLREGAEVMAGTVDLTVVLSVLLVNYK